MNGSCSCGFTMPVFSGRKESFIIRNRGGTELEYTEFGMAPDTEGLPGIPARVTAQHRDRYEIVCEHGRGYARLKTKAYYSGTESFPTVGDFVMVNYIDSGDSQILSTLPRRTWFSRREPGPVPREQAVAANFDWVFLLQSMNRNFNPKRLERYLTVAWNSGAVPVILLTKADLTEDHDSYLQAAARVAPGVDVHAVSARTGYGLEALDRYLQPGKTVVFLGSSGVGKSSLVNALAGIEIMTVNGIREADSRGRHTTTHRQLIRLSSGVMVIDTPGMRELGVWDAAEGLEDAFADVERYVGQCRFSDCRHEREPGCAVRAAIAAGKLDPVRLESYRKLQAESLSKEEMLRRKRDWAKGVAKYNRQRIHEDR